MLDNGECRDETPSNLAAALARLRVSMALPPLWEFSAEHVSGHIKTEVVADVDELERALSAALKELQTSAWQRVQAVLRCRTRLQFIVYGLPTSDDLIDDMVQQTLLKSHRSFASFIGATERQYFAWIFAILDNVLIDFAKKHRRGQRMGGHGPVVSVDACSMNWSTSSGINIVDPKQETPSTAGRRSEAVELLYAKIAELDNFRQEIVLRKMADETFGAIASHLGSSKPTVCRQYHSALMQLRAELEAI